MPIALIMPEPVPAQIPPRKRWTRAECALLESSGMWDQQKLELIDGEVINKMGKNRAHANAVLYLMHWLMETFEWERVNQEVPIDVAPEDNPTNEPQPDLIVLTRPSAAFRAAPPGPLDLALVVEVSDSTVRFDLTVKASLYARAGIVEYWVLDIPGRRLIVHRDPIQSAYRSVVAYSESERVAPLGSPASELLIGDVLPS